jgi:hypothetical protein
MPIEDDLVWYLIWRVREEDGIPAKTRLVKLLYLVDLNSVRDRGEQATSFRWLFYHFGPYAPDIERIIDRQLGNTIDLAETGEFFGDRMYVYRLREYPPATLLPDRLRRYCDEVCDRWALEDLNDLLSYVYFETPPMVGAVRGEPLDLSRVRDVEWPLWYRALPSPELDPSWQERREEWRRRFEESFPLLPLDPAPRRGEGYEESFGPDEAAEPEEPLLRGRLAFGSAAEEA